MEDENNNFSLKQKLKNSVCCFSCCFRRPNRHQYLPSPPSDDNPSLIWVKPTEPFSEIKDKCKSILGISNEKKHRRHSSMEFNYDPLSYSLNFEEKDESAMLNNFTARLPPSPPPVVRV